MDFKSQSDTHIEIRQSPPGSIAGELYVMTAGVSFSSRVPVFMPNLLFSLMFSPRTLSQISRCVVDIKF